MIHDIILGTDFLSKCGIDIKFSNHTIQWIDQAIPMKPRKHWYDPVRNLPFFLPTHLDEDTFGSKKVSNEETFATKILPSKYEKVQPEQVTEQQHHLDDNQKRDLQAVLHKFPTLFSGKLGKYPNAKVHLNLRRDHDDPYHAKPYSVPHMHMQVFKDELHRLCEIDVLEPTGISMWAAPTFITPKKDGRVRWVSDFRVLNKSLQREKYPIPRIHDILTRRKGYKFFTKIDISMQYYAFELDEESKDLCTIVTPFGKYRYKRLPMGVKQSADIAQMIMEQVLADLDDVDVYIDDVGCFNDTWEDHMRTLTTVLQRLEDAGFTVNPLKCEWAVKETDWLGHWLTPTGLKPWSKRVRSILAMKEPTNVSEIRSFIGAVNFYRDMWPRRAHLLAPITDLTGKQNPVWTEEHSTAFKQIKALVASDAMLAYPDHNKPFEIYTDASDKQLGAVIIQNGQPVAYYTRKLTKPQQNYTTGEKELLSIVATLKEFRNLLLGADINIYTDHLNNTFFNT